MKLKFTQKCPFKITFIEESALSTGDNSIGFKLMLIRLR